MEMSIEKIDPGMNLGRMALGQFFPARKSLLKPQISATDFWGFVYFCPKKKTPGLVFTRASHVSITIFPQALEKPPRTSDPSRMT